MNKPITTIRAAATILTIALPAVSLVACNNAPKGGYIEGEPQPPVVYQLATQVYSTLQQVWAPKTPTPEAQAKMKSGALSIYNHTQLLDNGLGVVLAAGIPWIEHTELAPNFMAGNPMDRRSLAYLWVVADPQLIDEESPIRMEGFATTYRPHGHYSPQILEAHVRTARRISSLSGRPFDFALLPGDLTDTGQKNELDWLITALNGGVIDPDSGVDNDPVPGPGNDYNDPFISDGIGVPWFPALGNHDALYMGSFLLPNFNVRQAAISDTLFFASIFGAISINGFVAGDTVNAKVMRKLGSKTPADPERLPLNTTELLQTLYNAGGAPVGHGFTQQDVDSNKGYYSAYPISGKPIKMLVLNTTNAKELNPVLGFRGFLDPQQFTWLEEELNFANTNNELVIIVTHHRLEDFHNNHGISATQITQLLAKYDNLVLLLTGHGHKNTINLHDLNSQYGFWELMSASTIDFPLQSRAIELVDEGNGYLSIYVTNFDHNSTEDSLAHHGRHLAGAKRAFGNPLLQSDVQSFWEKDKKAQNLLLRLKLPDNVRANLATHTWPTQIESLETLANF